MDGWPWGVTRPDPITYTRYDNNGNVVLTAANSAFVQYNGAYYSTSYSDLVNYASGNSPYLSDTAGLFTVSPNTFLMYSAEDLGTRFSWAGGNGRHFVVVQYSASVWHYDDGTAMHLFPPCSSDVLVATIDMSGASPAIAAISSQQGAPLGIQVGWASGNIAFAWSSGHFTAAAGYFSVTSNQATKYLYGTSFDASLQTAEVDPDSTDSVSQNSTTGVWTINSGSDHTSTTYDLQGQTLTSTDQRGVVHQYSFDAAGRQTADTVTSFGSSGIVDQYVAAIVTAYDDVGRVDVVTSYGPGNPGAVRNQVVDAYDGWGNLTQEWQAHSGVATTTGSSQSPSVQYTYQDSASSGVAKYVRLTNMTYPNGRQLAYNYGSSGSNGDILSRLDNIASLGDPLPVQNGDFSAGNLTGWTAAGSGTWGVGGTTPKYFYWDPSSGTNAVTLSQSLAGQVVQAAGHTYTLSFTVDIAGGGSYTVVPKLLLSGVNVLTATAQMITVTGNLSFQYTTISGDVGKSIAIEFDFANGTTGVEARLENVALTVDSETVAAYTYLGAGTIVKEDYVQPQVKLDYTGTSNSLSGLDRFGRIADQVWANYGNSTTLDEYTYGYNAAGDRTSRTNAVDSVLSETYQYDNLDRLTAWSVNGVQQKAWGLDSLGNDLNTGSYTVANEETPNSGSSGYDLAGNMTTLTSGDTTIYDAWNRLVEVDSGSAAVEKCQYDGMNRRIQVSTNFSGGTAGMVTDDYLSGQQVVESNITGGTVAGYQYLWSPRYIDAPILRDTLNTAGTGIVAASRIFYLGDANYNVTALVSTSGQVLERYSYTPYGVVTYRNSGWSQVGSSANGNTILYTGREIDNAISLYYYRARFYDAGLGRFVGKDSMGYAAGDVNLYRYVGNEPVIAADPSGLDAVVFHTSTGDVTFSATPIQGAVLIQGIVNGSPSYLPGSPPFSIKGGLPKSFTSPSYVVAFGADVKLSFKPNAECYRWEQRIQYTGGVQDANGNPVPGNWNVIAPWGLDPLPDQPPNVLSDRPLVGASIALPKPVVNGNIYTYPAPSQSVINGALNKAFGPGLSS